MNKRDDDTAELRAEIERRYADTPLGSGAVGGTFGEILCHELHMSDAAVSGRGLRLPATP